MNPPSPAAGDQGSRSAPAGYFPEIDGMRAVAVLAVFCFHLDPRLLPGGFIGVDVFFVISGFLIGGLVMAGQDAGRFSYLDFYHRRIARIVPAATLVIAAALLAGDLLYDRQELSALGADAGAAALSVMNVKQLFEGGYFTASSDTQPLIHYWSLAVEEQFYLLFPALIQVIGARHRIGVLIGLCLAGYAVSIVTTPIWPTAGFYLLHTRAWELLAGAVLAGLRRDGAGAAWRYPGARLTGGLLLIGLGLIFARSQNFPGWIAILPVSGTILMLSALGGQTAHPLHRALVNPAVTFIGRISFSLYLWHWVVFSFANYALFASPQPAVLALKLVLPFVAAIASYYAVERPARAYFNHARRRAPAFGFFLVMTALIAGLGLGIRQGSYLSVPAGAIAAGGLEINAGHPRSLVLIGDSQAAMYAYDIAQLARDRQWHAVLLASAAHNELPGDPDTLWPQVDAALQHRHFDVAVLAQAWGWKLGADGDHHLRLALAALLRHAGRVIIIDQLPVAPAGTTRQAIAAGTVRLPVFESADARSRRSRADRLLAGLADARVTVMPVADLLTNADGSLRVIAANGRSVYHDQMHLSSSGEAMVHARLQQLVEQAMAGRTPGG